MKSASYESLGVGRRVPDQIWRTGRYFQIRAERSQILRIYRTIWSSRRDNPVANMKVRRLDSVSTSESNRRPMLDSNTSTVAANWLEKSITTPPTSV